jgi:hypothetical protein
LVIVSEQREIPEGKIKLLLPGQLQSQRLALVNCFGQATRLRIGRRLRLGNINRHRFAGGSNLAKRLAKLRHINFRLTLLWLVAHKSAYGPQQSEQTQPHT